jgi:peptidoglycan/xylan/chitin deacetylase (PgdA/CDA1 family)
VAAKFILSFDCEGKWGVADVLTAEHGRDLASDRLRGAYRSILEILDEFEITATFAFVGAFAQSPGEFAQIRAAIEALGGPARSYLGPALRDINARAGDGWHGDDLVEQVAGSRAGHEIALHGVTHVPWTMLDEAGAEAEMALFRKLRGPVRESRTFVYPRNLVAHQEVLSRNGFAGYRAARPARSRALSLLSEFNLLERPQHPPPPGNIVEIPAGFFLNWRRGLRRLVPPSVTRARAKRLLNAAAADGAIVHYWLHPENVASAPATLELVRALSHEVARSRESGNCEVMTQLGYCRWAESLR